MAAKYASDHERLVQEIISKGKKDSPLKKAFIHDFFAPVMLEVLEQFETTRAHELASYCFEKAAARKAHTPIIHIAEEKLNIDGVVKRRVRLVIVNDDMPFLVDSVSAALSKLHVTTHIMLHPILQVDRNAKRELSAVGAKQAMAESLMYIELAPLPKGITKTLIEETLAEVLAHVRVCVDDWRPMEEAIGNTLADFDRAPKLKGEDASEVQDFVRWLHARNFVFLGHAFFTATTTGKTVKLTQDAKSALGLYRLPPSNAAAIEHGVSPIGADAITITKASCTTHVHRNVHMDLIVIKHRDKNGTLRGETRFLGLFTSNVYYQSAMEIPIIRNKIGRVLVRAGYKSTSHSGKALRTIFEFLPRDEVFLMSEEDLFEIGMGVLSAEAYPQVRSFLRRDAFARHVSALVYIPRERFSSNVREEVTTLLESQFKGSMNAFYTQISDSPLARLHVIVDTGGTIPDVEPRALETTIAALVNNWADGLRDALVASHNEEDGEALAARYADAFPNPYIYGHAASDAAHDIRKIEAALRGDGIELELYKTKNDPEGALHLKCFTRDMDAALSDIFPLLENMGLTVRDVVPYKITAAGAEPVLLRDFSLKVNTGRSIDVLAQKTRLEEALHMIWRGKAANDSMNALLFLTELTWRDVAMLRGYVRYLQQIGFPYRLGYMSQVLSMHHGVASLLSQFFHTKFDPSVKKRDESLAILRDAINGMCESITNLAEDRILRRILAVMEASLRTNFFICDDKGQPRSYISFKFASALIPELPLPKPYAEIFVTSQRVEGIHLRGDKVARGGLRWSDRAEDFRTEVLGLVKAQMVKNAVIVPGGAKGGFVVRQAPAERDALQAEAVACYREFLSGLLDITDNIVNGDVVPPAMVVRHDMDDPYLVVAADKGTATFSDIANSVAADYGFWLGDAFASGGSVGYDHKVMAITARGAWVAVQRHFREMGRDVMKEPFTAIGIGDMSGDVFGNGLLLSKCYKLVAAFNHKHIFFDPTPDMAVSFKERERLFNLPRSQWSDYDAKKISAGGGIFERAAKSITLTKEMRTVLDTQATKLAPDELIQLILKAPVDLLWNGGIGTYVKAISETHDQVGDRNNNAVRINGSELRCKVVGEGGNLGFTQLGRMEYARHGGRINTDAIDNSAGVDCSDHEVNIKIALGAAVAGKKLSIENRNKLLKEMTDEVAELVLVDNRLQTQALSIAEHQGTSMIEPMKQLMHALEADGFLNRKVEYLPDDKQLDDLRAGGFGFTRPELAVMLAYSKMALYRELKESPILDDAYFTGDLMRYFPDALEGKYKNYLLEHRLKREIIATMMTNSIVNRTGITLAHEFMRETGLRAIHVALAYTAVRDMFSLRGIWRGIEKLDGIVDTDMQLRLFTRVNQFIAHQCRWLLSRYGDNMAIDAVVSHFAPRIRKLEEGIDEVLSQTLRAGYEQNRDMYVHAGVPDDLAARIARMEAMSSAFDIIEVSDASDRSITNVAELYFELGARLRLGWLRQMVRNIPADTYWHRQASNALKTELYNAQRRLTGSVLEVQGKKTAAQCSKSWADAGADALARYSRFIADLESMTNPDFATLTVALRQVQSITG